MDQIKVYEYMQKNRDYLFPNNKYSEDEVERALMETSELLEYSLESIPFRNPATAQILAVVLGVMGVDRFYLGDVAKGCLKYLTVGGIGIWWIMDMISAKERCRAYNTRKLIEGIHDPSVIQKMHETNEKIKWTGNAAATIIKNLKE
jgi:hypothetical protein